MQIHQPSITGSLTLTGSLSVTGLVENQSSGLKAVKIDTSSGAFYFGEAGSSVPSGTISGSIQVDHDATTNYVANEHIDHTSVSITAGDGLSGGGDISSTSTLTLDTGSTHFSTGVSASAAAAGFGAGGGSGTIAGSGTTDYIPVFTNSTTLGDSPIYKSTAGDIGIGTTSPTTLLDVNGTTTTVSLVETSTRELKEDIQPLENQLEKIKQLQPVEFTWKKDKKKDFGLIAEEVEEIYPYLVEHDSDDNLIGVKYSKLTSVLIKALQEQQHQIDELKAEITHLKNK